MEADVSVIPTISIAGTPTEAESSGASFISQPVKTLKRQHSPCDEMDTRYLLAGKDVIDTGLFISLLLHLVKIQVAKGTSSSRLTWAGGSEQALCECYLSSVHVAKFLWTRWLLKDDARRQRGQRAPPAIRPQDHRIPFYSVSSDEDWGLFSSPGIHISLRLRLDSKAQVGIDTYIRIVSKEPLATSSCRITRLEVLRRRYECMWDKRFTWRTSADGRNRGEIPVVGLPFCMLLYHIS